MRNEYVKKRSNSVYSKIISQLNFESIVHLLFQKYVYIRQCGLHKSLFTFKTVSIGVAEASLFIVYRAGLVSTYNSLSSDRSTDTIDFCSS